jgi:hypothetical protein
LAHCQNAIKIRLDSVDPSTPSKEFDTPLSDWFYDLDPNIDLAATSFSVNFIRDSKLQSDFFASDLNAATMSQLQDLGVSAGDGVFILGFPMNLVGERRNYVIARGGALARISELLEHASNTFLVDAFVFPENSGGPVVLRPEVVSIQGTKANNKALLVGVVTGYQPYSELAISAQTKRPRIEFEENSGLAIVLPIDYVNELVREKAIEAWSKESAAH